MITKQGRTKIVNFVPPGARIVVQRRSHNIYYLIRRILLFYQVLDNIDYFVGISLKDLSTGQ